MKRFLFGFLAVLFLILNTIPYLHIMADDMPTDSQYEMLGAYALSSLITTGEATELDFSDYTDSDTSFLIDLGEAIFTGDYTGLVQDGLEWLGDTADSVYDSYKEYISQWKYDHLGIMYSDWFPDEQIRVGIDDSYSLANPIRNLLSPRDNSSPAPTPDPTYSFISNINNIFISDSINFIDYNKNYIQSASHDPIYHLRYDIYDLTFTCPDFVSNQSHLSTATTPNNGLRLWAIYPKTTIYINSNQDGSVSVTYSSSTNVSWTYNDWESSPYSMNLSRYDSSAGDFWGWYYYQQLPYVQTFLQSDFAGLSTALNYIYQHYANINLYVDGVLWVESSQAPTYPIVIPGQLTIYNNQPLEYTFPPDTHIDLPDLTNIIRNAINSSGVVMWSDIADCFVDVNGQTAVAVTKIVRNDYDNLYNEQYPYPAMLVGMTDQTKFNEHLLDNSHAYLSPINTVVENTIGVLPSELVGVLAIGAILTIFAVIINRLLE